MSYQLHKQFAQGGTETKKSKWIWWLFKMVLLGSVAAFACIAVILWNNWQPPLTSPISDATTFSFLPYDPPGGNQSDKKVIYGFLPYWNIATAKIDPELTHLAYFALTVGYDGSLKTQGDDESLTGYQRMQSDAFLDVIQNTQKENIQMDLVVKQFNPEDTGAFLRSKSAQSHFFEQLSAVLLAYPFRGVNLDIELSDGQSLQTQFSDFVANLDTYLAKNNPGVELSIDVYPSAAQNGNIWNLNALGPHLDYVIVMAYDFHRRQSPQAGPVSPLLGGDVYQNINQHLKEILELVPSDKVVLGVPFYGYEWQTTSRDEQAFTFPDSGSTASYQRVLDILDQKKALSVEEHWNEVALSPYLSYKKNGLTYVIYYENARSLSYKLDYVNQLNLRGIAIWALGYEGDASDLWSVINSKLNTP